MGCWRVLDRVLVMLASIHVVCIVCRCLDWALMICDVCDPGFDD